jgi:hypothetical protein
MTCRRALVLRLTLASLQNADAAGSRLHVEVEQQLAEST